MSKDKIKSKLIINALQPEKGNNGVDGVNGIDAITPYAMLTEGFLLSGLGFFYTISVDNVDYFSPGQLILYNDTSTFSVFKILNIVDSKTIAVIHYNYPNSAPVNTVFAPGYFLYPFTHSIFPLLLSDYRQTFTGSNVNLYCSDDVYSPNTIVYYSDVNNNHGFYKILSVSFNPPFVIYTAQVLGFAGDAPNNTLMIANRFLLVSTPNQLTNNSNGTNGTNGIDGTNGTNGLQGNQGLQGEKGDKGNQGNKGDQGDTLTQQLNEIVEQYYSANFGSIYNLPLNNTSNLLLFKDGIKLTNEIDYILNDNQIEWLTIFYNQTLTINFINNN